MSYTPCEPNAEGTSSVLADFGEGLPIGESSSSGSV